jgi:hypothetical protein
MAEDEDPDAPRKRALAWLEGPNLKTMVMTRFDSDGAYDKLLEMARRSIVTDGVAPWVHPIELEAWLNGLIQGCASTL